MESWMKNLPSHLRQLPLGRLAIPGSHDTGAYDLQINLPLAYDQPFSFWPFVRKISGARNVKRMIQRWAETQSIPIIEQLKLGIRYLDLRLDMLYHKDFAVEPYLVHALYGKRVIDFLEEIKNFLEENDKEVIILDVNHIYRMGEDDFIRSFLAPIESIIGREYLCPTNIDIARTSLDDLIQQNYRLIIIGPFDYCLRDVVFSHRFCKSSWPRANNSVDLVQFMKNELNHPLRPINFHVLQGVMTAKASNVAKRPHSNLKDELSMKALRLTTEFIDSLTLDESQRLNIVIADQVDIEFTRAVVEQNFKIS